MPLGDHLDELRRRLIVSLVGLLPIAAVAFYFGDVLLAFLVEPARGALRAAGQSDSLQATNPLETLGSYMTVSTIATILVGSPWMLYQLWRFIAPGLYKHERRFVYFLLPLSSVLTATGVMFLFTVIMPIVLTFLVGFGTALGARDAVQAPLPAGVTLGTVAVLEGDPPAPKVGEEWVNLPTRRRRVCVGYEGTEPLILSQELHKDAGVLQQYKVSEYVRLLMSLSLAFAAAFQAPVVVLLLGWAGIIDQAFLKKYRRHAILICAVAAAMLTPGDPSSMIALLIPLYGLYELGGVLLRVFPASRVAGAREEESDEA